MSQVTAQPGVQERFARGWIAENPVYVQLLGMCPTLAVTNTLAAALTLGLATMIVLVASNLTTSLLRNQLQPHLRILVYTLTIATFVTIADRVLAAGFPDMSRQLGPYVPLIIVNCLIISRAEACASRQSVGIAVADAIGQGGGFLAGLLTVGVVRELLGSSSIGGMRMLPAGTPQMLIFVLPAGAFLTLGSLIAVVQTWKYSQRKQLKGQHDG